MKEKTCEEKNWLIVAGVIILVIIFFAILNFGGKYVKELIDNNVYNVAKKDYIIISRPIEENRKYSFTN